MEPGSSSTSVLAPMPGQVAAEDSQTGEVAEARGTDDLGNKGENTKKLTEVTEVEQAQEKAEEGRRRKDGERKATSPHTKFRKEKQRHGKGRRRRPWNDRRNTQLKRPSRE